MDAKERNIINSTNFTTLCKTCGHTRDHHQEGDLLWQALFGVKLMHCWHCDTDQTQPEWKFWKRDINCCTCKKFIPVASK